MIVFTRSWQFLLNGAIAVTRNVQGPRIFTPLATSTWPSVKVTGQEDSKRFLLPESIIFQDIFCQRKCNCCQERATQKCTWTVQLAASSTALRNFCIQTSFWRGRQKRMLPPLNAHKLDDRLHPGYDGAGRLSAAVLFRTEAEVYVNRPPRNRLFVTNRRLRFCECIFLTVVRGS